MRFQIFKDTNGSYRWRLVNTSGLTVASGVQIFSTVDGCRASVRSVKSQVYCADIDEVSFAAVNLDRRLI